MKLNAILAAGIIGLGSIVSAQTYTQGETKYVTIDGEVIRYEPGRVIVVRGTDNKEISYTLAPAITVPADVQIGRRVTLYTAPTVNGAPAVVSRVVTTSVTPAGDVKRTTEDTTTSAGVTTKTTTTEISGKVESYATGKTLTISRTDGTRVTYVLDPQSKLPTDLVVGRTVVIRPLMQNGREVARTVTYVVQDPS